MKTTTTLFLLFLLSFSLVLSGCFGGSSDSPAAETQEEMHTEEELAADVLEELEEIEINTESSDVVRSTSLEVVIQNGQFNPVDISVSLGDTVEWVNLDSVDHTVSFEDARFDVEVPAGASVSYTFDDIGDDAEARYFCRFHPNMRGSALVLE